ncbi:MAG TPA: hypothetical protein VHF06_01820 [Pseudonocardiaceae bacterium]|jgi:hypothetical protein|nr:hypothetical protein [Pseudonocardiaceae bacterium]
MTSPQDADQPVPGARLAEETRLLLDALAERAQPWLNRLAAPGDDGEHTPSTCNWCPLCAGMAVLRGERPELAVKAAEHAAGLIAVLRAALAERPAPASSPSSESSPPASAPEPAADPSRVQHIPVRRHDGGDE